MSVAQRLPKCIATVSISGTLPEKLATIAEVGYDGVEIFESDLLTFGGSPAEVRRIAEGLGLTIFFYQPFRDFEAMPEPQRTRNMDRAERKFDVMQALGTDLVLVCSNVQAAAIDDDERAAADLAEMAERAARRGLRVGFEALAWGTHINRWGHAWKIVRQVDHPSLGLMVDSFHTLSLSDDYAGIAEVPGDKIFSVQLADGPKLAMDVLSWSRHYRTFPGQGALDVIGFTRALLESGYRGPLSLEVFNDEFRAAPARGTARDGLRSLIFVESEAGGPELPAPPVFDGFEFLEFALDHQAREELAGFLKTLGFHHTGTHRSKDIHLYRQGGVNLILDAEQDSAASEFFHLHGPSVRAMGFRVDNAARAVQRARALLTEGWKERIGPGERQIPAVRGREGTLFYLIEPDASGRSIWDDDFVLHAPEVDEQDAGLVGIDHVVQALPAGRMDNFVLFYRAVFGLRPEPLLEIPDPYGLIRSRAMKSDNDALRIVLNVSESRDTATGRVVSAYAGAGVHHIALLTHDAVATVERMQALGARLLPIPANYYEDLAAKWGLDDAELARLQRLQMLYDREGEGEFRNTYTDSFKGRFFFEVVERRRNYKGSGAANAVIHMAAQSTASRTSQPTLNAIIP
jgi:4-hydroxyphenylpyruvate dioxygenase